MLRYYIGTAIVGHEVEFQICKPTASAARLSLVKWAVCRFPGKALPVPLDQLSIKSESDILDVYTSVFDFNLADENVFTIVRLSDVEIFKPVSIYA
jgi:hypothetical protein